MKRLTFGLVLLVIMVFVLGCNKDEDSSAVETEISPEETVDTPEPEPIKEEPQNTFPLTGVATDDDIDYRVFGVMIENSRAARPQSGLYQADLVYEVLSEATITRLLAFYHSEKPEIIGPVRSARDYYINLNNGYNGIYVSAGGSPQAFAMFERGQVDYISGLEFDGSYFYRSSARKAPHNMYTTYDDLIKAAERKNRSLIDEVPSLPFLEEGIAVQGKQASEVAINYGSSSNNVVYKYDDENNKYIRIIGGKQSLDLETENPVLIDNLFIVEMTHKVIDKVGRREIDIYSGGKGLLLQNGVYQVVEWKNEGGQILPFQNEKSLGFVQGKTWINVVPHLDGNVSIID
ncbi:hypothetical protein BKP45_16090 [Anaerobacillus alkalidiazotrophicus]|uniref:Lipoprotein YerB n=1 Tax=Anaerobacillus alkalidiazotrophicus TaxID=472963 RepID=A0A1S2M2A7_9BACI|nr:DUF3048 domain-containing protein [Anaerobacillus alkalidiazotrophicus]OIJ18650.1 hypothetical protein BKP45_16090 [Anaerobacillus alkalidiazotrophicus]